MKAICIITYAYDELGYTHFIHYYNLSIYYALHLMHYDACSYFIKICYIKSC